MTHQLTHSLRTQIGAADLIKVLRRQPDVSWRQIQLLGFDTSLMELDHGTPAAYFKAALEAEPPPTSNTPVTTDDVPGSPPELTSLPEQTIEADTDVRFAPFTTWRVTELSVHEKKSVRKAPPKVNYVVPEFSHRDFEPRLMFTAAVFRSFFHHQFIKAGNAIDVPYFVREISQCRMPDRLPRVSQFSWRGLHLIYDGAAHLWPYAHDRKQVRELCQQLPIEATFTQSICQGLEDDPMIVLPDRQAFHDLEVVKGMKLLVLSDLGLMPKMRGVFEDARLVQRQKHITAWTKRGLAWTLRGAECYALYPGHLPAIPEQLKASWQVLPWGADCKGELLPASRTIQSVRRLAALLAPALSIDAVLLRSVRLLLPASENDPTLEAIFWSSDYLKASGSQAIIDPKYRERLLAEASNDELCEAARELILKHHAENEGWYFTAIALLGESGTSEEMRDMAKAWFADKGGDFFYMTADYLNRHAAKVIDANQLWQRHCKDREDIPDYISPTEFELDEGSPVSEFQMVQKGGRFELVTPDANGARVGFSGSPLGTLRFRNNALRIEHAGKPAAETGLDNAFWLSGTPPTWAHEWGRDQYGPWVTIKVKDVIQKLRWIPPGTFMMGSPEDEVGRDGDEGPQHEVTLSKGYWLFETPCTQALWEVVMGENPSEFKEERRPVERISWEDVQVFFQKLDDLVPGLDLTLPTEAQWEYACRAGSEKAHYGLDLLPNDSPSRETRLGESSDYVSLDDIAWYDENSDLQTHEVALKIPNHWGLYDMLGNVWEWCLDGRRDYTRDSVKDPAGQLKSDEPIVRGGSWYDSSQYVRAAYRLWFHRDLRSNNLGFRPVQVSGHEPVAHDIGRASGTSGGVPTGGAGGSAPEAQEVTTVSGNLRSTSSDSGASQANVSDETLASPHIMNLAVDYGEDKYGYWLILEFGEDKVQQKLRWIPPGRFKYGEEDKAEEKVIEQGFWMFETPCTQDVWTAVMGENPSHFKGGKRPVEMVSWDDCQSFCLIATDHFEGIRFELPPEVNWEYACRAGSEKAHYGLDLETDNSTRRVERQSHDSPSRVEVGEIDAGAMDSLKEQGRRLNEIAWYRENSDKQTHNVAQILPNNWGLYDMLGNVWEFSSDLDDEGDPVVRGGSWSDSSQYVRAACRLWFLRGLRDSHLGFRPVVQVPGHEPEAHGKASRLKPPVGAGGAPPEELADELAQSQAIPDKAEVKRIQGLDAIALPTSNQMKLITDVQTLTLTRWTQPDWAIAAGRDRYGLWAEIEIGATKNGKKPRQKLRWIPPGRFMMGSPEDEVGRGEDEQSLHEVVIAEGFWMFETSCTQEVWLSVMGGENPSYLKGEKRPVERVDFDQCMAFCEALTKQIGAGLFTLPTEAKWEYACRAGSEKAHYGLDLEMDNSTRRVERQPNDSPSRVEGGKIDAEATCSLTEQDRHLDDIAWYDENSDGQTQNVAQKLPNDWGLYDMLGNVWEWSSDFKEDDIPVVRGGSWRLFSQGVRAACRGWDPRDSRGDALGFRPVLQEQASAGTAWASGAAQQVSSKRANDNVLHKDDVNKKISQNRSLLDKLLGRK